MHILTSSELAAWLQAVGSLAAIGVAIAVPFYMSRQDRRHFENERRVRAKSHALVLLPIVRRCRAELYVASSRLNQPRSYLQYESIADDLRVLADLNRPLEIQELGNIAHPLLDGIATIGALASLLDDHHDYLRHGGEGHDPETGDEYPIPEPASYEPLLVKAKLQFDTAVSSMLAMFD